MNQDYTKSTQNLKEIQDALDSKKPQLAFQRMTQALRTDNDFKMQLLQKVKDQTGVDLSKPIAGANLKTFMPAGLIGRGADFAIAITQGMSALIDPSALFKVAATSPRLVGEAMLKMGVASRYIKEFLTAAKDPATADAITKVLRAASYTNRTQQETTNSPLQSFVRK